MTNGKSQFESEQAVSGARQAWNRLLAQFAGLVRAVEKSVLDLQAALFAQDQAAAREALGKLKPAYSRLFLKFG